MPTSNSKAALGEWISAKDPRRPNEGEYVIASGFAPGSNVSRCMGLPTFCILQWKNDEWCCSESGTSISQLAKEHDVAYQTVFTWFRHNTALKNPKDVKETQSYAPTAPWYFVKLRCEQTGEIYWDMAQKNGGWWNDWGLHSLFMTEMLEWYEVNLDNPIVDED